MHIHLLQHVAFENAGYIAEWAIARGHTLSTTKLFTPNTPLPHAEDFDMLCIIGGPMSVHDTVDYPWMTAEKQLIAQTINANTPLFGICLGAQLIAEALGATISTMNEQEIGWFPITWQTDALSDSTQTVFHWHGEKFSLPDGATPIATNQACKAQGFTHGNHILALQFHLEMTPDGINSILQEDGDALTPARNTQTTEQIRNQTTEHSNACKHSLFTLLDQLTIT